jgi:hypothetical protein
MTDTILKSQAAYDAAAITLADIGAMMRTGLLAILLLSGTSAAAKPAANKTIPVAFLGDWALEGSVCAPGPADSGNMRITAKQITNFESVGQVIRVKKLDPHTIRVESRITHGGGDFGSIDMMTLSTNKARLTIGEMSDMSVYKRCAR